MISISCNSGNSEIKDGRSHNFPPLSDTNIIQFQTISLFRIPFKNLSFLDSLSWISRDNMIIGDRFCNHRPSSDDDIISNDDLSDNSSICSNIDPPPEYEEPLYLSYQ